MLSLTDDHSKGYRMRLNFLHPEKMEYDIFFIARTLARTGRFNNICDRYLSVAEHCWHASHLYPENPLGALMHDATEAFTGDVTTHLKALLEDFKPIERRLEDDLINRFDYEPVGPDFKSKVDTPLFYREECLLFDDHQDGGETYLPNYEIFFWPADYACQKFYSRYWELKGEIPDEYR
jgi:hypothetical protein